MGVALGITFVTEVWKFLPLIVQVSNSLGFSLSVIYLISMNFFLMFLGGFLHRTVPLIVTIHYLTALVPLIFAAVMDAWTLKAWVAHIIWAALTILAIVGTVFIDMQMWYITVYSVIVCGMFYFFAYLDGYAFMNGVYRDHGKEKGPGMVVLSWLTAPLIIPIPLGVVIIMLIIKKKRVAPKLNG